MYALAKGPPAHTAAIIAKIRATINVLEFRLHQSETERDKVSGPSRSFYDGRVTAFLMALEELRGVLK